MYRIRAKVFRDREHSEDWRVEKLLDDGESTRLFAPIGSATTARVPGQHDYFLINPYGLLFEEITASSLVKIDTEGNKVEPSDAEVNKGGFANQVRPSEQVDEAVARGKMPSGS
jgi:hypothetical protein